MSPTTPRDAGTGDLRSVGRSDRPGEAILDVVAKRFVLGKLGGLGPLGAAIGMPLRCGSPIFEGTAAGGCVAPEFPRNGRRRAAELRRDLPYATPLCVEDRDLLSLCEGQVAT